MFDFWCKVGTDFESIFGGWCFARARRKIAVAFDAEFQAAQAEGLIFIAFHTADSKKGVQRGR